MTDEIIKIETDKSVGLMPIGWQPTAKLKVNETTEQSTQMKDLELGQMLFGNPTEEYSVPREKWMGGPFQILIDAITEKTGEKNYGYTPHFSNDFFIIRPYYWGDEEDEMDKPNFEIPSENFRLTWYKYPFRSSYANEKLTPKRWNDLIQKCIKSLDD